VNKVEVKNIEASGNRLSVHFHCTGNIKRFFTNNVFFAEYDTSIEEVPEAILVIPFLASVCPIAWANHANVCVGTICETFLHSLKDVRKALQDLYPTVGFTGNIHASDVAKPYVDPRLKSMMLFSGGVDSLATYIRHQTEAPILVTMHGADVDLENYEAWKTVMNILHSFCSKTRSGLMTVRSNFTRLKNDLMLASHHKNIGLDWWGNVMDGLASLGLCAPIAYVEKIGTLYIAAGATKDYKGPSGSLPSIDGKVRWAGTKVVHDGFELTRQEKVELIADYIRNTDPQLHIRSCYRSDTGDNCSQCEKCSRTIVGLEMAGIDPNEHGFHVDASTFAFIKEKLSSGGWHFAQGEQFNWEILQRHACLHRDFPHSEVRDLLHWLKSIDIELIRLKSEEIRSKNPELRFVVPYRKYVPDPMFKVIRFLYRSLSE